MTAKLTKQQSTNATSPATTEIASRKYATPGAASQFNLSKSTLKKAEVVRNQQRLRRIQNAHRMAMLLLPVDWRTGRIMTDGTIFFAAMRVSDSVIFSVAPDLDELKPDVDLYPADVKIISYRVIDGKPFFLRFANPGE